jgi:hypothetical protein
VLFCASSAKHDQDEAVDRQGPRAFAEAGVAGSELVGEVCCDHLIILEPAIIIAVSSQPASLTKPISPVDVVDLGCKSSPAAPAGRAGRQAGRQAGRHEPRAELSVIPGSHCIRA